MTFLTPEIRVSVAIPTRDRGEAIRDVLGSILAGSDFPDEIVVMDQSAGTDTSRAVHSVQELHAQGQRIQYFHSKRRGLTANRNDALARTTGEFVVFADDDITVDGEWLRAILDEWIDCWNGGRVLITGRTLPGPEFAPGDRVPSVNDSQSREIIRQCQTHDALYGVYFGASRDTFRTVGKNPWDERLGVGSRFPGAEDDDFAYRTLKAGIPIVFEPKITVWHHPPPRRWARMRYTYAIGGGAFMAKHLVAGDWRMLGALTHAVGVSAAKAVKATLHRDGPEALGRCLAILGLSSGFVRWLLAAAVGRLGQPSDTEADAPFAA